MRIFLLIFICHFPLTGQNRPPLYPDSMSFFRPDTLHIKLTYPSQNKLPPNLIKRPLLTSPLEVDMRSSSFYTPREVQDKLDHIMQRPRSDNFVPVMAMAAFAINVAARQLQAAQLFEPKAEDYLLPESELLILKKLWIKSPLDLVGLYNEPEIQNIYTAAALQTSIFNLAEKNLIKTRSDNKNDVLFFAAQKLMRVKELLQKKLQAENITDAERQEYQQVILLIEKPTSNSLKRALIKNVD